MMFSFARFETMPSFDHELPMPTSWRGSLGPCWHNSAAMKRALRRQQPEISTLKFTKGMADGSSEKAAAQCPLLR
jgi:hypothetical protein